MIARFFLGLFGLIMASIIVRTLTEEIRRARMQVRKDAAPSVPRAVALKQDPKTGVYYPAD